MRFAPCANLAHFHFFFQIVHVQYHYTFFAEFPPPTAHARARTKTKLSAVLLQGLPDDYTGTYENHECVHKEAVHLPPQHEASSSDREEEEVLAGGHDVRDFFLVLVFLLFA